MEFDDFDVTVKVIVVGNGGVGKTSLTTRFCKGAYTDTYKKTIGVDFMEKDITLESTGEPVKMMLWDTAGQEEFKALTSRYFKGASAAIIVFSTTDRDSFLATKNYWFDRVRDECGEVPMALVQNKVDMIATSGVSKEEVEALATEEKVKLYRSSVKNNINVNNVFYELAEKIVQEGTTSSSATLQSIEDIGISVAARNAAKGALNGKEDFAVPSFESSAKSGAQLPETDMENISVSDDRTAQDFRPKIVKLDQPSRVRTGGKKRKFSFCNVL